MNKPFQKKDLENLAEVYRKLAPYLNIGYTWAASVIILTLIGRYLDNKWSSKPWLTLLGALLGIGTGFYNFIRVVTTQNQEKKDDSSHSS
ncbi:MAG: hypothetical protein Kow0042_09930 [Calditrichia bacterium]